MLDSVSIYDAKTKRITPVKVHMSRLSKKSCMYIRLDTNKKCGEPAMHMSVYGTGIFPRCTKHGRIGTGHGDEYVMAIINEYGLHVLPKGNIDDILYYECDGCGTKTVAVELQTVHRNKNDSWNVCSKCSKGASG